MRLGFLLIGLIFISSLPLLNGQAMLIQAPVRELKLTTPTHTFFIPIKMWNEVSQQYSFQQYPSNSLVVFKSPVKHTALFCQIEDLTLKKFGVMIQLHVGDYNSYMDKKIER